MSLRRAVSQPSLVDSSVVEEKDAYIEIMATMTNMIKLEIRPGRYVGACFGSYNWGPMTCNEQCQCCPSNASMQCILRILTLPVHIPTNTTPDVHFLFVSPAVFWASQA